jgi:hypothetical protein
MLHQVKDAYMMHEHIPQQTVLLLLCGEAKFEVKRFSSRRSPGPIFIRPHRHRNERFVREYLDDRRSATPHSVVPRGESSICTRFPRLDSITMSSFFQHLSSRFDIEISNFLL